MFSQHLVHSSMASRKRSHDEDDGPTTVKRRNVSTTNGSPAVNGDSDQDEPVVDENLEASSAPYRHTGSNIFCSYSARRPFIGK